MSFHFIEDQVVSSPSGRYRLDILSPLNGNVDAPESQRFDWCYRLWDQASGEVLLWERWFKRLLMEPTRVWTTDEGNIVVAVTGPLDSYLVSLSPRGDELLRLPMLPSRQEPDRIGYRSEYIIGALGGTFWDYDAIAGVFRFEGREHFFITFLWGESIVADLVIGRWFSGAKATELGLHIAEQKVCLNWLGSDSYPDLQAALASVSRRPSSEAIPLLRLLESSETWGSPKRDIDKSYEFCESEHGHYLKLALRRCGELPAGIPCYTFQSGSEKLVAAQNVQRDRLWDVPTSLTWREVLQEYGAPDFIGGHFEKADRGLKLRETWGYFVGVSDEISVARLYWEDDETLQNAEVTPIDPSRVGEFLVKQNLRPG